VSGPAELRALTAARGIAAWGVVLYHVRLSIAGAPAGLVAGLAQGYLAVDFFFLLSGFVMWIAWGPRLHDAGWAAAPAFLQRRIARIWPLHATVLAGTVLLATVLALTGRADGELFAFDQLPLHAALVHNWGMTDRLTWNVPSWSISTELFAYLAFVPLTLAADLRRLSTPVLVALLAATLLGLHAVFAGLGYASPGAAIPQMGLFRCVVEFGAGTLLGALWMRWRGSPRSPLLLCAAVLAAAVAGVASGRAPQTLAVPAAFAALLMVLALTAGARGHPLEGRLLHYLGEISFATYLCHYPLWIAFKLAFVADPYAVPPALIALYLTLVLAGSVALHHLVERPAQRAINALRWRGPLARA